MTTISDSSADSLSAATAMGAVTLKVASLDTMLGYYRDGIGLELLAQSGDDAVLGRSGVPSMILSQDRALTHASPSQAGLYHTAFLFPEAGDLAASVYSVARKFGSSFTGSSDHLVSKALYFDDPEGNGVELYWDRPRSEWTWEGDRVAMGTVYLDPNRFLSENLTESLAETGPVGAAGVGHVHLKVGDIPTARSFYVDTLGFEITAEYGPQALFVAAGGYHHHIGMNTWQSAGAGPRTPALGLGQVTVRLGSTDDLGALRERLASRGVPVRDSGAELAFDDPWSNVVKVAVAD